MAHAQKPDLVFRRNGRVHSNRREASLQSNTGSRGVRISGNNAGYTTFRGSVRVLATRSIRQFLLRFLSPASPCAITFQLHSTTHYFFTAALFTPTRLIVAFIPTLPVFLYIAIQKVKDQDI